MHFTRSSQPKRNLFLPQQVAGFFLFWNKEIKDNLSSTTFLLTSVRGQEPVIKVLEAVNTAFNIIDVGDVNLDNIALTDLQTVYEEIVIPQPKEGTYQLKTFLRARLKPIFRMLFDLVHNVFLYQIGTCDQVTIYKFRIMFAF